MRKTIRTLFAVFLVLVILSAQMLSAFAVIADGQVVKKEIAITHNNLPIYIHHIDGTGEALYCIDHDALSPSSFTIPSGSVFSSPIAYWNALTPTVQQSLRMVLFYAPKVYNDSTKYQCAAAQIVAWEYLSGTRAFTDFRTTPLSYPDLVTSNSTMYTAYQSLISKIQRHHKIPTINAATITVTGIGEANAVLTNYDENSVLATDWEPVSPDPRVHAEIAIQDGRPINRLKVWISEDIGDDTVTIALRHKTLTDLAGNAVDPMASTARWIANYPYEGVPNIGQPLIGGTLPDPITANLKVRAELGAVLKIVKQSPDGHVAGIRFKVEKDEPGGIGWWTVGTYTTDASGEIKLEDRAVGDHFRVTELVPDGYVCESDNPQEITLAAGENTLTFRNRAQIALVIEKQSLDGQISGISFKVEKYEPDGIGWWTMGTYTTDANGEIKLENRKVGDKLRVTEIVPDGYVCESENPQEITLAAGGIYRHDTEGGTAHVEALQSHHRSGHHRVGIDEKQPLHVVGEYLVGKGFGIGSHRTPPALQLREGLVHRCGHAPGAQVGNAPTVVHSDAIETCFVDRVNAVVKKEHLLGPVVGIVLAEANQRDTCLTNVEIVNRVAEVEHG